MSKPSEYLKQYYDLKVLELEGEVADENIEEFHKQLKDLQEDDAGSDWCVINPDSTPNEPELLADEKKVHELQSLYGAYQRARYHEWLADCYDGAKQGIKLIKDILG